MVSFLSETRLAYPASSMVGDPGGGTLKNQAGLAWWGYGYGLHGTFTGEFCDEGTKGLSNWKAIEGRVGSL